MYGLLTSLCLYVLALADGTSHHALAAMEPPQSCRLLTPPAKRSLCSFKSLLVGYPQEIWQSGAVVTNRAVVGEGIWQSLEQWARDAVECCKLMAF